NMQVGATTVCSRHKGAPLLAFLLNVRPPFLMMWPNIARAIAATPGFDPAAFDFVRAGPLLDHLPVESAAQRCHISNSLGMTETAGPHTTIVGQPLTEPTSMGPPAPGMQHRIVDP